MKNIWRGGKKSFTPYHMLLRDWRKAQGLNFEQGAEMLGVSVGWLSGTEGGLSIPLPERIAHVEGATKGAVTYADHWSAWCEANPTKLSDARATGRSVAKAYRKPAKSKGKRHGGKVDRRKGLQKDQA